MKNHYCLLFAAVLAIVGVGGFIPAPAAQLIAHWDFEKFDDGGTTIKSTVGGYVGTVQGQPAIVPISRPGGGGNGLDISGGGQGGYIVVDPETSPDNMVNKAAVDDALSIVFWEKNNRSPADGCCDASTLWFESPSSAHGTRGVNVHVPWSNGEIMFDNTGCCTAGTRLSITPSNFDFTQWHHYAFIKNKETKQIWIDGNLVKEAQGADPLPDDFTVANIGSNGNADGHKSPDATIDDFALYKGALTEAEIKAIVAGTPIGAAPKAELVAHWDFEKFDDGGKTIKSTVGGYVGTVQGQPAIVPVTRPGGGGNGLDISGGGQGGYIIIDPETSPDNMVNKAAADDAISIVVWEKNNRSPADGCCDASTLWFESPSSAHGTRGVNVHVPWSNGEIMFDNTGCCTAGTRLSITPSNFDFKQWHHYAFIKNKETKQIWIDGNLVKEGQGADPLPSDFTLAIIGANGNADGHKSPDATIDDFALYKGALTEAEIKAIAAGTPIGGGPKTPVVAHWDFEKFDDGGTTIKSTVGGYVGTVQGNPAIVPITRPGGGGNGLDVSAGGYIVVDPETSPDNMVNKAAADDALSIAFWEKNNRSPADGCCDASTLWFESPSSAHGTRGVNVHVPWSNGEIMFDNTGCCTAGTRLSIIPSNFDFKQWHHYAFIKNKGTKQIWIDGNLVKEGQGADPLPSDFTLAIIGANGNADGHKSPDATIDDFTLYKGALTEAEIKALAAGGGTKPPDTVPPVIVSAVAGRRPINTDPVTAAETVTLTFSEEVVKPSAVNVANYSISPSLAITKAELTKSDTVVLTTANTTPGTTYTVTVNGVRDTSQNLIAANSTARFVSFSLVTQGILKFALYGNITDTGIDSVRNDPRYPNSPDFTGAATALDNTTVVPDDSMVHYGATITGLLTPTETGDYDFFIRGNQAAQLLLNSAGADPAGAEVIASDSGASKNFLEPVATQTTQTPISLVAGKQYFVQLIYKREANSGDLCQVAWRKTTDATPAAALLPIPGRFFTAEPTLGPSPAPPVIPPVLGVSRSPASNNLIFTWSGGGTLQRSDSVNGPWTNVAGAVSPHSVAASGSAGFFRISQ